MQLLKTLASYLREYKKYALLAPLMVVLEVLCELALPLVMAKIVDVGIAGAQVPYILRMGAAMPGALPGRHGLRGALGPVFRRVQPGLRRKPPPGAVRPGTGIFLCGHRPVFFRLAHYRMTNDVNAITMMLAIGLRMLTRAPGDPRCRPHRHRVHQPQALPGAAGRHPGHGGGHRAADEDLQPPV